MRTSRVSIDPSFERSVLAEFRLRERRAGHHDGLHGARLLAQNLHRGSHDLLAHLRRVATPFLRGSARLRGSITLMTRT